MENDQQTKWIYHDRSLYEITAETDKQYIGNHRRHNYEKRFWKDRNGKICLVGDKAYVQKPAHLLNDEQAQLIIHNGNLNGYRDAIIKELCARLTDGRIKLTPDAAQDLNLEYHLGIHPAHFGLAMELNTNGHPIAEDPYYNKITFLKA